jgi:hypothetical protein
MPSKLAENIEESFYDRTNLFDELKTRELKILWEHTFEAVPETEGDGITKKFWNYSPGVNRAEDRVEVPEGEYIETKETGDYGAGQPATPGFSVDFNQEPVGDEDGFGGYWDQTNGAGFGWDSTDPYVFLERNGSGRTKVHQSDWNINTLQGDNKFNYEFDPTDGFICRLPHACYGHGSLVVILHVKITNDKYDVGSLNIPVHVFRNLGESMWSKYDLPVRYQCDGTQGSGFWIGGTAAHYEAERGRDTKRINGQSWHPNFNAGSTIDLNPFPQWTYIMGMKKRDGWESADVTPNEFTINADANIEVQFTVRGDFNDTSFGLPEDTSPTECAMAYDLRTYDLVNEQEKATPTSIVDRGEREYTTTIPGDKQSPVEVSAEFDNLVLASNEIFALMVRPATSSQTIVRYASLNNGGGF